MGLGLLNRHNDKRKSIVGKVMILLAPLMVMLLFQSGYAQNAEDHEVKAVFLYHFSNFIRWPKESKQAYHAFNYCIIGKSDVNSSLAQVLQNETIHGKPFQLLELTIHDDFSPCKIVFFTELEDFTIDILHRISLPGTLTVSDSKTFVQSGGMISLVQKNERIHPLINMNNVARAGLKISSKLLRLATLITSSQSGEQVP